ncbi:hypothetical protein MKX03_004323 [Papaver bracteatum]|nr:hypothetical protein MKX03_004323 [Papaver bracteatum]
MIFYISTTTSGSPEERNQRFLGFFSAITKNGSLKSTSSPVPVTLFTTLAALMLTIGLIVTDSFFIYEATSSRKTQE